MTGNQASLPERNESHDPSAKLRPPVLESLKERKFDQKARGGERNKEKMAAAMRKTSSKKSPNPRSQEVIWHHRSISLLGACRTRQAIRPEKEMARITHPRAPGKCERAHYHSFRRKASCLRRVLGNYYPQNTSRQGRDNSENGLPQKTRTTPIHTTVPTRDQLLRTFPRESFLKARFVLLKQPLLALRLVQDRGLALRPGKWRFFKPFRSAGVSVALIHVCIAPERIDGRGLPKARRKK